MTDVLALLTALGCLGAFDSLYFHEWRARLPARGGAINTELKLHVARDSIYFVIFGTLPWLAWQGVWAVVLAVMIFTEILVTLTDFVVEDRVRIPLGGVFPGERVTHALMAIVYGALIAELLPVLRKWWNSPSHLRVSHPAVPLAERAVLIAMAVGIAVSGCRDLYAVIGGPRCAWPWTVHDEPAQPAGPA